MHDAVGRGTHEGDAKVEPGGEHKAALVHDAGRCLPDRHLQHICACTLSSISTCAQIAGQSIRNLLLSRPAAADSTRRHTEALDDQASSSASQGCLQKQGFSICYTSKARDALHCQAIGAGRTCLDCDSVAQAGLILVPCDLDVGPILKSPRMVLWRFSGPQLLALECDCAGTWHVSFCAWTKQCPATGVLHSSG